MIGTVPTLMRSEVYYLKQKSKTALISSFSPGIDSIAEETCFSVKPKSSMSWFFSHLMSGLVLVLEYLGLSRWISWFIMSWFILLCITAPWFWFLNSSQISFSKKWSNMTQFERFYKFFNEMNIRLSTKYTKLQAVKSER